MTPVRVKGLMVQRLAGHIVGHLQNTQHLSK